jgi:hypothetical protein
MFIVLASIWILFMVLILGLAVASGHIVPAWTFISYSISAAIGVLVIIACAIGITRIKKSRCSPS